MQEVADPRMPNVPMRYETKLTEPDPLPSLPLKTALPFSRPRFRQSPVVVGIRYIYRRVCSFPCRLFPKVGLLGDDSERRRLRLCAYLPSPK